MKASEAREISIRSIEEKKRQKFEQIDKLIEYTAAQGLFDVMVEDDGFIDFNEFIVNGYEIEICDESYSFSVGMTGPFGPRAVTIKKISWKNA